MGAPALKLVTERPIQYPESDGAPMAETDRHRDEMVEAIEALKLRYRADPEVYVTGNILFYYEQGDPTARFAPDVLVAFGVPRRARRVYKLWEERAPAFVLEVTSRGTRFEDRGNKRELCAELGVEEYVLFDPDGEYLTPRLQGFRLTNGLYAPIGADVGGCIPSETLGLLLGVEGGHLRFFDPSTRASIPRIEDHAERARQAEERAQREAERVQREVVRALSAEGRAAEAEGRAAEAEGRAAEAEAEITRLRALLDER
jgi:Uma2 family endonuclease